MIHTIVEPPVDYFFQQDPQQANSLSGPPPVPAALEKTRMCVYYLQGRCKYDDCSFAHSQVELKQAPQNLRKTKLCDLFMMGHCLDAQCNFAHSVDELKVRPKRSMSSSLSPSVAEGGSYGFGLDRSEPQNSEFCARTILSMLIKMQPEAAVSFLSNPECKIMLARLLEDKPAHSDSDEGSSSTTGYGPYSSSMATPDLVNTSSGFYSDPPVSSGSSSGSGSSHTGARLPIPQPPPFDFSNLVNHY